MNQFFRLAFLLFLSITTSQANPLHINILDVGEGQSILLRKNNQALLIDTGHAGQVYKVLDRIQQLGIGKIDALVLTHLHPDHASGYFTIKHHNPEIEIIDNCQPVKPANHPDMVRWVSEALEFHEKRRCVIAGDYIDWVDLRLQILWPFAPVLPDGGLNHQSLVIQIDHLDKRLLIMGDVDVKAEKMLLNRYQFSPVDVLVVGHHGAADASSEAFIQAIRPDFAVISVNKNNIRGYPAPTIVQRLERYSRHLHQTWKDGEFYLAFK